MLCLLSLNNLFCFSPQDLTRASSWNLIFPLQSAAWGSLTSTQHPWDVPDPRCCLTPRLRCSQTGCKRLLFLFHLPAGKGTLCPAGIGVSAAPVTMRPCVPTAGCRPGRPSHHRRAEQGVVSQRQLHPVKSCYARERASKERYVLHTQFGIA